MLSIWQASRVYEVRILESEPSGFPVHGLYECFFASRYTFSQRYRRVVSRLYDHATEQLLNRHAFVDGQEHAGSRRLPGFLRDAKRLYQRDLFLAQCIEDDIRGQEFSQRRRFNAVVRITGCQRLPALEIDQEISL